jgi:hypothetical protein
LEDAGCEVAGSWADFEDGVGLLEEGFGDYGVGDAWVLEDVLTWDVSFGLLGVTSWGNC